MFSEYGYDNILLFLIFTAGLNFIMAFILFCRQSKKDELDKLFQMQEVQQLNSFVLTDDNHNIENGNDNSAVGGGNVIINLDPPPKYSVVCEQPPPYSSLFNK